MPAKRVLSMGLLSKYPTKSRILQKFANAKVGAPPYTDYERQHMVALWHTPEITASWIKYQFERLGIPEKKFKKLIGFAYHPVYMPKWRHLGRENVLYMGQPEVERYYLRSDPNKRLSHPTWALPILNDHRKQGMTIVAIADKYHIPLRTLHYLFDNRSIFQVPQRGKNNTYFKKGSKSEDTTRTDIC